MTDVQYSFKKKMMAWILSICLVVTLIPEFAFAVTDSNNSEAISPNEVTEANVIERTENITTYDLGDGEKMSVIHGGQVRFKDDDGKLVDYDPSLIEIKEGEKTDGNLSLDGYSHRNKTGDKKQYLPEKLSERTPILMENQEHRISLTMTDETIVSAKLNDADICIEKETIPSAYEGEETLPINAVYGEENDDIYVMYTSGENGIKETITLNEHPATNIFRYKIDIGNLKIKENVTNEGLTIIDEETEDIVAGIEPPWMNDATGEAYSEDITYTLEKDGEEDGKYILIMTISEEYLNDPETVYPVVIDPTTTWKGNSELRDTYVISGSYAGTNFYESGTRVMPVGKNSTGTHRTYMQFVGLKGTIEGQSISSAKLTVYETGNGVGSQQIRANRNTEYWGISSLTWNNKPAYNTSAFIHQKATTGTAKKAIVFTVTSFAKKIAGSEPNYGIVLRNVSSSPSYAEFYGSRTTLTSYRPKLVVTYYSKPTRPTVSKVTPDYVKNSTEAKITYAGVSSTGLKRVEYRVRHYNDETDEYGEIKLDTSADRAITSGTYLPDLGDGCYKVYVRGVNKADAVGVFLGSNPLHVDSVVPDLTNVSLKDNKENAADRISIEGKVTDETDPVIGFEGVNDMHLDKAKAISYAITETGKDPQSESEYKLPTNITISDTAPYRGSFYLNEEDRNLPSGKYDIHIKVTDKAGNNIVKKVRYFLDRDDPTGTMFFRNNANVETSSLKGVISVTCDLDGTGSDIVGQILKVYKTKQTDEGFVIDGDAVYTNNSASEIEEFNTIQHCPENGTYRFVLYLEDGAGREAEIIKDVTVDNALAKPTVSIDDTNNATSSLSWSFTGISTLNKIMYRFDDSEEWQQITEGLTVSGNRQITVPSTEGTHTIYVKGKNQDGLESNVTSHTFNVDKTEPSVSIESFTQGYLNGTITDNSLKSWAIYVKDSGNENYDTEPVFTGKNNVNDSKIAFIDLTEQRYTAGQQYTFKLEAEDNAGNKQNDTLQITVPTDDSIASKISPAFRIIRNNGQEYSEPTFRVATFENGLELSDPTITAPTWYIGNNKKDNSQLKNQAGDPLYAENTAHDIVVTNKAANGDRSYSVSVIRNGMIENIDFDETNNQNGEYVKDIDLEEDVVSFRVGNIPSGSSCYVKAGTGNYYQVNSGVDYYVEDMVENSVHADEFTIKVIPPADADISQLSPTIYFDTIVNESFMMSEAENYVPKNFSASDKINFKTYIKWDVPTYPDLEITGLPEDIYYELYRGTSPDFEADEDTLIDGSLKSSYFAEMNIEYSRTFYYKVCAVKKDANGNVIQRSSFDDEQASTVVDEDEYTKFLGLKEYWEYADFTTPAGEGAIEKSHGNFVYTQTDAVIPNEGLEVDLTRAYNSQSSSQGAFGFGWSHEYDIELLSLGEEDVPDYNNVILKDGNGTVFHFIRDSKDEKYISSLGAYINLETYDIEKIKTVKVPEGKIGVATGNDPLASIDIAYKFLLSTNDGMEYYFNSSGQLVLTEEPNDNFIIFVRDTDTGLLNEMKTSKNLSMKFKYNTAEGEDPLLVKTIELPDGSIVEYGYDKTTFGGYDILESVTKKESKAQDAQSITYTYDYGSTLFGIVEPNLKEIRDAEYADDNTGKYEISYDNKDRADEVIFPNEDRFTLTYSAGSTWTVTKKFSDDKEVHGEKDFFDEHDGRCLKTISGVENIDNIDQYDESQLDVTIYEYYEDLLKATTTTVEKDKVGTDGFITRTVEKKTDYVSGFNSNGDPVSEKEGDGTTSSYTYYTDADTSSEEKSWVGLVKSVVEKSKDGTVLVHEEYKYDNNGNITEINDKVNEVIITRTYYTEDSGSGLKGELKSEVETMYDGNTTVGQSTLNYSYEYYKEGNETFKKEICTQTIDGETISVETIYDSMGREVYEEDSRDFSRTTSYDGFGRPTEIKYEYSGVDNENNQDKETVTKSYDKNGLVINETLEDGTYKEYGYDSLDRVVSTKVTRDSETITILTTYAYEDVNIFTGKGTETREVKNAFVTTNLYPAESGVSENQRIISKTYEDSFGRTVRTYQNGMYTDMTYNMQGDMVTKFSLGSTLTPADGILEVYVYDDNGNLTDTIINPGYEAKEGTTGLFVAEDSIRTRAEYDKAGNITYQTDALGNKTGYGYDDKGKLKSVTLPGEIKGTLSDLKYEYTYDEDNGSYTTKDIVKDPKGNKSIVVKDYLDQTLQVADIGSADTVGENSLATSYDYDIKGNLIKATEQEGNYKTYSYDTHDRVTAIEYFKANDSRELKTVFTYDSSDNLLTMRDYKYTSGSYVQYRYTGYEYDEFNRLISVSECNKASDPTDNELEAAKIRYEYDSRDNLIGIKYPDNDMGVAGIALTYDKITGLVTKAEAVTAYNSDGEPSAKTTIREYSYNHMNQVSDIKDYTDFLNDTSKYMLRSYRYDDFGRPIAIEYTDNMSGSSSDVKEGHYYTYDKNYNIIEERIENKYGQANGAVSEETRSYSYDELGRLVSTSIEKVGAPEEFDEETGDPVAGEDNTYIEQIAYEYDAAGNRTKVTKDGEETDYSYNGYNQLTSAVTKKLAEGVESTEETEGTSSSETENIVSNKAYTYDKNGNQLTEVDSTKNTSTTFRYDADNRLIYAQGKTGDTVEYTHENGYNGFGQRILKKETKAGIVGTTNYFYDGTQVLYTEDAAGEKTSFNIIGAEDNILTTARFESDVASFYTYTKDLRESTINLVGSDGTAVVSYEYDDFGERTEYQKNADEPFYNEVCYSAGIYDDTTGLYYLNARYYDPADAIFLTQDTYRGDRSRTYTLNYYAYCAGNPISYTDPTGHWVWGVVGAAMGAYDGYKYAKKKKLKGVKKAAAIVGGAALGAINPFKVVKAASKAGKLVKNGVKAAKALKNAKKGSKIAKATKGKKLKVVKPDKKLANNRYNKATNKAVKKASNNDVVTYRRVQGGTSTNCSQDRIIINSDGTISIPNKKSQLSISIDGSEHSDYFLKKRGENAQVIEFDVPKWFDDFLKENTIPQKNYRSNPLNQGGTAPKLADPTTPGNSYEVPAPWIEWIEEYAVNARIKTQ